MKKRKILKTSISQEIRQNIKSGMENFFVELDMSVMPSLNSIKISFDYLNLADFVR